MKLKCIFFALAFLALTNNIQSQDYLDSIAYSTCDCIAEIETFESIEDRNFQLGICLVKAIEPYQEAVEKDFGEDFDFSSASGEELGRKVGMKMVTVCPDAFFELVEEEIKQEAAKQKGEPVEQDLYGTITKIENTQFVSFTVKDSKGKRQKLFWLYYFQNSDEFIDNYEELKGKKMYFTYYVEDIFDPRINEYTSVKIITGISENE